MSNIEIKRIVNDLADSSISLRFPRNIGSSADENSKFASPEAQKFSIFMIKGRRGGNVRYDKGYIALPFPVLSDSVNVNYNDVEMGVQGAAAVGSLSGNLTGYTADFEHILKTGLNSFNKQAFLRVGADLATYAFPALKASLVNGLGTIQNPYITNVFKDVGFRQFSFDFDLVPRNKEDSDTIQDIIKTLKTSMMPENLTERRDSGPAGNQSLGVQTLPDIFDIRFYSTTKNYTQKTSTNAFVNIKEAVLTNLTSSYSSDTGGMAMYEETNAPLSVKLSMTFQETAIYTRERCEQDYNVVLNSSTFG